MNKLFFSIIVWTIYLNAGYLDQPKIAMIVVPVADALPLNHPADKDPVEVYTSLPYSPDSTDTCLRVHQLLFNEVGVILDEYNGQVLMEFPHFFGEKRGTKERFSSFWVLDSQVRILQPHEKAFVPEPIHFNEEEPVVSLIMPWMDEKTEITYSAGTRFKNLPEKNTSSHYALIMLDARTGQPHEALIDKSYAWLEQPRESQEAKKAFVSLLKLWANQSPQKIPYVLGGCSCMSTMPDQFYLKKVSQGATAWERLAAPIPHTGFDCSGLILRAAQLAGIKSNNALYPYKNTITLAQNLTPLSPSDELQEGDLIFFPGHVMIISDLARNLLIQAVGYDSGYACVHEIPLSSRFKEITTYSQLRMAPQVTLIDKKGTDLKTLGVQFFRMGDV